MATIPNQSRLDCFPDRRTLNRLLLAISVLLQATLTSAASYYVATTGIDSNSGSESAPFRTIQRALNITQAGDRIVVAPGTYDEALITSRSGTAANPITIDGNGSATVRRLTLAHSHYICNGVTFKGTTNMYSSQLYFAIGANSNIIRDCVIDSEYALKVHGIQWQSLPSDPDREASDNIIERTTVRYVWAYPMVTMCGSRNILRTSLIRDGYDVDFLRLVGRSNLIQDNQFLHNRVGPADVGNHPDFVQTFGNNGERSFGHVIERNLINGVARGQLFQFSATGQPDIRDWTFRNNVFANAALGGGGNVPGMRFFNNVFYKIGSSVSFGWRAFGFKTGIDENHPIYPEMTQPTPSGQLVAEGDGGIYRFGGFYQVRTPQILVSDTLIPGRQYQARTRGTGLVWYNGTSYSNQQVFTAVEGITTWSKTGATSADLEATQLFTFCALTYMGRTYGRDAWFKVDPSDRQWTSNFPDAVAPWRVVIDFAHRGEMKNNVFLDCGQPGQWQGFYAFDLLLNGVSADYNYVGKDGFQPILVRQGSIPIGDPRGWGGKGWYEPNGVNGGDPMFFGLEDLNFRLRQGSPLIDRGTNIPVVNDDHTRTLRPVGATFDIGAFEFSGSVAKRPSAPVGLRVP